MTPFGHQSSHRCLTHGLEVRISGNGFVGARYEVRSGLTSEADFTLIGMIVAIVIMAMAPALVLFVTPGTAPVSIPKRQQSAGVGFAIGPVEAIAQDRGAPVGTTEHAFAIDGRAPFGAASRHGIQCGVGGFHARQRVLG
jgi:hypothetical protein